MHGPLEHCPGFCFEEVQSRYLELSGNSNQLTPNRDIATVPTCSIASILVYLMMPFQLTLNGRIIAELERSLHLLKAPSQNSSRSTE